MSPYLSPTDEGDIIASNSELPSELSESMSTLPQLSHQLYITLRELPMKTSFTSAVKPESSFSSGIT